MQSTVPLGVVVGYGITAILDQEFGSWRYSYHTQAGVYFILLILFAVIPRKYIEDNEEKGEKTEDNQESHSLGDNPREIKEEISGLEDEFMGDEPSEDSGYN